MVLQVVRVAQRMMRSMAAVSRGMHPRIRALAAARQTGAVGG
jgi:hypothetical protein